MRLKVNLEEGCNEPWFRVIFQDGKIYFSICKYLWDGKGSAQRFILDTECGWVEYGVGYAFADTQRFELDEGDTNWVLNHKSSIV